MRKYVTYEEPYANKEFTEDEMKALYNNEVDKLEYTDFESWLIDMLKSGVFEEV